MRDVVLQIRGGHSAKTEFFIETLKARLSADADTLAWPQGAALPYALTHQGPAETGPALSRRRDDPTDRRLGVLDPGVDDAQNRLKSAMSITAQQVVRLLVHPIRVLEDAGLLHHEDFAAQRQHVVHIQWRELLKPREGPVQTHQVMRTSCFPKLRPLSKPMKASGA